MELKIKAIPLDVFFQLMNSGYISMNDLVNELVNDLSFTKENLSESNIEELINLVNYINDGKNAIT